MNSNKDGYNWDEAWSVMSDFVRNMHDPRQLPFISTIESLQKIRFTKSGKIDRRTLGPEARSAIHAFYQSQKIHGPNFDESYLSEYESLVQKRRFFDQEEIETEKDLLDALERYESSTNFIFRGMAEAKYRIYSSIQRSWIYNEFNSHNLNFGNYVNLIIDEAKNSNIRFLLSTLYPSDSGPTDLSYLAYLQHYGCPTPLIDWTADFKVALYFASQKPSNEKISRTIDQYFSVSFLSRNIIEDRSISKIVSFLIDHSFLPNKDRIISQNQELANKPEDELRALFLKHNYPRVLKGLGSLEKLLSENYIYFERDDGLSILGLENNLNIINQKGLFLWNSSPFKPIEVVYQEFYNKERGVRIFAKSLNINKKLRPVIKRILEKRGITQEYIYPNPQSLSKGIFERAEAKFKSY